MKAQDAADYVLSTGVDSAMWINLSDSASHVSDIEGEDDEASGLINIGFTFNFAGNSCTQFSCNSNGRIRLGAVCSYYWSQPFTTLTDPSNNDLPFLSAFGMDNTLEGDNAYVKYELVGTAPERILVIEYSTPSEYDSEGDYVTYQIQLHESGNVIRFVYGTTSATYFDDYQIGIANSANDYMMISPLTHAYNNASTETTYSTWPGAYRYYQMTPVIPNCPRVSGLVATNVTSQSALLTWTAGQTDVSWIVSDGIHEYAATDTSFLVDSLNPNTDYTLSVRAICTGNDTSSPSYVNIRTHCGAITVLPFTETFESVPSSSSSSTTFVSCWKRLNDATSYRYPYVSSSTTYNHTLGGTKGLYWYNSTSTGTYGSYQCVILPATDSVLYPVNNLELLFWAKSSSTSYYPVFQVGVMTDTSDISSFQLVETVNIGNYTNWNQYSVNFSDYTGYGSNIAIRAQSTTGSWYSYVDDITLREVNNCPTPENFTAISTVSVDSVVVGWNTDGVAQDFEIAYGLTGFDPDTLNVDSLIVVSSDSTYVFTNLQGGVSYDVYVRTACATGSSYWTTPLTVVPGSMNMAVSGTSTVYMCGGVIYDDGGSDGTYSMNCNSTLYVYPSDSTKVLVVSGVSYTESTFDYLRIYDGIGTTGTTIFDDYGVSATQTFGPYTSSDGPITITFHSDGSVVYSGFTINVTCTDRPACPRVSNLAVNTTSTTATLSWTENGTATSWNVAYVRDGLPDDSIQTVTANTPSVTLTGLTPNSDYSVTVTVNCSEGVGGSTMGSFHTECVPLEELPYAYGFEGAPTGSSTSHSFASCWTRVNNGTQYYGYPYISSSSTYCHSGSRGLYWYNYSASSTYGSFQSIVLPNVDSTLYPINTLQLSFWAKASSASYFPTFYVGVMTNVNDITSFVPVDTVNVSNNTLWDEYEADLTSYTGPAGRVAIVASTSPSWTAYLDDFTLNVAPPCPTPIHVTLTEVTENSATLDWEERDSTTTSWRVVYGPAGFDPTSDDASTDYASTHPYTITSLTEGTSYDAYIYAECDGGSGDISNGRLFSFRTSCMPIDSLPYAYGFEGTSTGSNATIDPCWVKGVKNTTTNYPYPNATSPATGTRSLYFYGYYSSNVRSWAALPMFADSLNLLQVKFKLRGSNLSYNYYCADITVGVMSNPYDINTFTPITVCSATSTTTWDSFTVFLDGHQQDGRYIAFLAEGRNSSVYYNYVYLDDVVVDYAPNCGPVTDIQVTSGPTSAVVSWTPSNRGEYTGATVEYIDLSDPAATWISNTVYSTNLVLTGLTSNNEYGIRVFGECVDGTAMPTESTFRTLGYGCIDPDTTIAVSDTVGTGNTTNTYIPSYSFYGNALTQQIYLASELPNLGQITGMHLHTQAGVHTRTWTIYLAHTQETSVDQWIVPTQMTAVWSGTVNYANDGWVDFDFTTPFAYDGSSNLLVYIDDHTGNYSSGNTAYGDNLPGGRVSRYIYRDGNAYDPYNPSSAGAGTALNFRSHMIFSGYACGSQSNCAAPPTIVTDVTSTSATLLWAPGTTETSWSVYYKEADSDTWIYAGDTTETTYTFSNLVPGTDYMAMVVNECGIDTLFTTIRFSTNCGAIDHLPFYENFDTWGTGTSVHEPHCWISGSDYSATYPYIISTNHGNTSGGSMYMYNSRYSNPNSLTYFVLPELDSNVAHVNQVQVVFYGYDSYSGYTHRVAVGVCTDPTDMNTFVAVDTITTTTSVWNLYEIPLDRYTDSGRYITFASIANVGSYCYPYIDDLFVEMIPTCQRPDSLQASNPTTTSIDLSWRSRSAATDFLIEYGRIGFTPGTGTVVHANTNPFTLTGLPSGYQGEFYVRNICDGFDTSDYSRFPCQFMIQQVPATIPYHYNFEDSTEWNTWQVNNNTPIGWVRGTAVSAYDSMYSMYISPDGGATFGTDMSRVVNSAVWRDVDFGSTTNTFELTFRYKCGGTTTARYDGLMVFLVDTNQPIVTSNSGIISPWGSVNDLYRIADIRLDTAWSFCRSSFDTVHGVKRVAFFWFNQGTGNGDFEFGPAIVDDINIDVANCPRPVNMDVEETTITSSTARVFWDGPSSGVTYRVAYREQGAPASTNQYVTTNTNYVTITGLNTLTNYRAWVQKICDTDSSIFSDGVSFTTLVCDNAIENYIGSETSTGTSYNAPVNNFYRYTLSETIIDSADLVGINDIQYISYYYDYATASSVKNNCTIYLQPTTKSSFTSTTDMVLLDTTIALKVYTGPLNCTQGWNNFALDTMFSYSGTGNLLVIVDDNSNAYNGSAYVFKTESCSDYKTITWYSDGSDPDPLNMSYSGTKTYYEWRPVMRFTSCVASCADPVVTSVSHDYQSATISWSGLGSDYEVNIKESSAADWPATDIHVTGNSYTFAGLNPATYYTFRVRQDCSADSIGFSNWVEDGFLTDSLPCMAPDSLTVSAITNANATFDWNVTGNESIWDVHVWFTGGLDSIYRVTSHPVTLGGFSAGLTYNVAVRAICGAIMLEGDWSDTITFTTATCPDVTGFTTSNVTANSVTLSWNPDPMAQSWTIEYGYAGFIQGQGYTVTSTTNSYVVNGLEDETEYDFHIKAVCGTDWLSEHWVNASATTQSGGVTCLAPTGVTSAVAGNSATISWTANTGNISYELEYGPRGFAHGSGIIATATSTSIVLNNLAYETQYDVYVRAICDQNTYSAWSVASTFTTDAEPSQDCDPVQDLAANDIAETSVNITWTPGATGDTWEVVLTDAAGTTLREATTSETHYEFTGLSARTNYIVKVRTKCDDDNYSSYVSVLFTTGGVGIDDVQAAACTIYPNPTSSSTTISVSGVNGKVRIAVIDMNGRTVAAETLECSNDCTKTMDVEKLAQGAYFVRITGDEVNMVKKLVVR